MDNAQLAGALRDRMKVLLDKAAKIEAYIDRTILEEGKRRSLVQHAQLLKGDADDLKFAAITLELQRAEIEIPDA